jgi:hypothetical protein
VVWGSGFYDAETTPAGGSFRWSSDRSRLVVFNDSALPKTVRLDFDVASPGAGAVWVDGGPRQWRVDLHGDHRHASFELNIPAATKTTLSFQSDVARVAAPADPRAMYFNVGNLAYTEVGREAQAKAAVAGVRGRQ